MGKNNFRWHISPVVLSIFINGQFYMINVADLYVFRINFFLKIGSNNFLIVQEILHTVLKAHVKVNTKIWLTTNFFYLKAIAVFEKWYFKYDWN